MFRAPEAVAVASPELSRRDRLGTHPRVALFADHWNEPALRTYRRLGFGERRLGVARQAGR